MNEWGVVGVIVTLVGLIAAVAKPLYSQAANSATMVSEIKALNENFKEFKSTAKEEHDELWGKTEEHEKMLADHEIRIKLVEEREGVHTHGK